MRRATCDGLVDEYVSVSNLDIKTAIRVSAYPSFVVNWGSLASEVRQRNQITGGALLATGHNGTLHLNLLRSYILSLDYITTNQVEQ